MNASLALAALLGVLSAGHASNSVVDDAAAAPAIEAEGQTSANPADNNANKAVKPPVKPPVPAAGDPLYAPIAVPGVPDTFDQKFMTYAIDTYGPRALFFPIFPVSIRMLHPRQGFPRDWRLGAGAFGRQFGAAVATHASLETGRFLASALLHEDFRYRPSTSTNVLARAFHAIAFTFVDKSDSGNNRIAIANFAGAASGGFAGGLYLPPGFNNVTHAETRSAIIFGTFAGQNLFREFAPDVFRASHKLHLPFPRIPIPEWWVKRD